MTMTVDRESVAEYSADYSEGDVLDLGTAASLGRSVRLPADAIRSLGLGELLEVARTVGRPYAELSDALKGPDGPLVTLAIAWVLARRLEPDLSWAAAQAWQVEVTPGTLPPPMGAPSS